MNIHLSPRELLILSLFTIHYSLLIAFNLAFALPEVRTSPCPACHGKRSLSLTPPNLGQFDGEIGVAPGVPFKTHRFDVRYDRCPLCNGSGRHEHMTMQRLPPPADSDATTPCASCFATGATACQKCRKTGYISCTKCQSNHSKQPGWLLTEEKTAGRTSRHMKKIVTPCGECKGIGKIECPACEGRGGTTCKKCNGEGFVPRKERK
jgi:hypothetical protein